MDQRTNRRWSLLASSAASQRSTEALVRSGVSVGNKVVIIIPQGIPAMTSFVGAMMIGAVPAFLAYPNFKVEAGKYGSGLACISANLKAKAIVIDEDFRTKCWAISASIKEQS